MQCQKGVSDFENKVQLKRLSVYIFMNKSGIVKGRLWLFHLRGEAVTSVLEASTLPLNV